MAIITPPWSVQQALDRGFEFYDFNISDWGDIGAAADPPAENGVVATPISDFPAQGIAIAPQSIIDRCYLQYNPLQPVGSLLIPPVESVQIGKSQPYIGRLPAPYLVGAFVQDNFGDTFTQDNGVLGTFGTALSAAIFSRPQLTLRLLLKGSGLSPGGRFRSSICDSGFAFTGGGTEDLIKVWPVHGRRRVRVSVTIRTAGVNVSFRVGVVQACSERNPIPPPVSFGELIETTVVVPTPVIGSASASFVIEPLIAEYITLYGEQTLGGAASFTWSMEAED